MHGEKYFVRRILSERGEFTEAMQRPSKISAVPPSAWLHANPWGMACDLWRHRNLIRQFTSRDILGRYKGSYLGMFWSYINTIFMLLIYTYVFSVIFKAKWGASSSGSKVEFALIMFCGMLVFNIFSESVNRAPGLILGNASYVKRVIFPLQILPMTILCSSLVQFLVSLSILAIGISIFMQPLTWTIFFLPLVLVPLCLFSLGLSWFVSSLGVFLRDIGHPIAIITQALFFTTPIFYPIEAVPGQLQMIVRLNPLTVIIENARGVIIWGKSPEWFWLGIITLFSMIIMQLGYVWFEKSKRAFADVV